MIRAWPLLVLIALLGGRPTPAFAQLKVTEKESIKLTWELRSSSVIAFTPDAQTLAVNDHMVNPNNGEPIGIHRVLLLDAATGKEIAVLRAHRVHIGCMAFNSDGSALATASPEGTIKLWDVKTRKQTCVLEYYAGTGNPKFRTCPTSLSFSPDGKTLASNSADWTKDGPEKNSNEDFVRLWDVATGKQRAQLVTYGGARRSATVSTGKRCSQTRKLGTRERTNPGKRSPAHRRTSHSATTRNCTPAPLDPTRLRSSTRPRSRRNRPFERMNDRGGCASVPTPGSWPSRMVAGSRCTAPRTANE